MTRLDPWGPILGVLFEDESSDFVLAALAKAGVPTHFELTSDEAFSNKTRKRAYQRRLPPIFAGFDEGTRHRVAENVARQLSISNVTAQRLDQALLDVGWGLQQGRLLPLDENSSATVTGRITPNLAEREGGLPKGRDAPELAMSVTAELVPAQDANDIVEIGAGIPQPVQVFVSYSHQDEGLHSELAKHLTPLEREGLIQRWHDRQVTAGAEFGDEIDASLNRADIILLLVSPDFIASEYCWGKEMKRAMERHEAGEARVIPVILRPVDWHKMPFGKLLALPKDGKAVTSWSDLDTALLDVAKGVRVAVSETRAIAQTSSARVVKGHLDEQGARHGSAPAHPPKRFDNSNPYYDIDPHTLTLHDLFMRDFVGQKVGATWPIGEPRDIPGSKIKWFVVIDLQARARFLEFYITLARDTYNLCKIIVESYTQALQEPEKIGVMKQGPAIGESSGHSSDESVFTGAVFVYYEGQLSDPQIVKLTDLFASKNLRVSFRGPAYLDNRKRAIMPAPIQIRPG